MDGAQAFDENSAAVGMSAPARRAKARYAVNSTQSQGKVMQNLLKTNRRDARCVFNLELML